MTSAAIEIRKENDELKMMRLSEDTMRLVSKDVTKLKTRLKTVVRLLTGEQCQRWAISCVSVV